MLGFLLDDGKPMLTKEKIESWKKLCDEAQRGPWYPANDGIYTDDLDYDHKIELSKENGAFIAASREAVPALIAEVERLRDWHAEQNEARAILKESKEFFARIAAEKENERLRKQLSFVKCCMRSREQATDEEIEAVK